MKWRCPKKLLRPVQSIEVTKYHLTWKPAPPELKHAPPFLAPFGFRPKNPSPELVFRSLEFGVVRTNTFKLPDCVCQLEWLACEDGACESPCMDQSTINSISGHGTSEIISSQPNKVLVYCADINKITAKKKSAYSALTSAQKKANAAKRKRTQEGNKSLNQDYPKKVESVKRLENKITELERTVVLLTQPAPRHS